MVPALLGLQAMDAHNIGVLPWANQLVQVPVGTEKDIIWPEGTKFINCKRAKTGHMMLPIGHFNAKEKMKDSQMSFQTNVMRNAFEQPSQLYGEEPTLGYFDESGAVALG
jgi:hypothetical protein